MKKWWLIGLIILFIFGTYFGINNHVSQEPPSKISPEPIQDELEPQSQLEKVVITLYSEDGRTEWELGADSIERFTDKSEVLLKQVKARVYQDEKEMVELVAASGEVDSQTGFLALNGPLTIKSKNKLLRADR